MKERKWWNRREKCTQLETNPMDSETPAMTRRVSLILPSADSKWTAFYSVFVATWQYQAKEGFRFL